MKWDSYPFVFPQSASSEDSDQYAFVGNVDNNNTKVYSALQTPTLGRYVRIYPNLYKGAPYMRAGVMIMN